MFVCLFVYFKSTTEGSESQLYCRRHTNIHKYTPYGNV